MDRLGVGDLRRRNDAGDREVTLLRRGRSNADVLVREPDMQGVPVRFRINGDRFDSQFTAGADDPQSDLPTVGDQYLLEHFLLYLSLENPVGFLVGNLPIGVAEEAARFLG